jgi:hypothetical protein
VVFSYPSYIIEHIVANTMTMVNIINGAHYCAVTV